MILQPLGLDLPDPGERVGERSPRGFVGGRRVVTRSATVQIRRHRDVELLRMCEPEVVHVARKIVLVEITPETRVVSPFLGNAGHGQPAVVVCGIQKTVVRQGENLLVNRTVHYPRISLLEIRAAATTDEQTVAGESLARVVEHEGHASIGVAGCCARLEMVFSEVDLLTMLQKSVCAFGAARRRNGISASGTLLQ